VAVVHGGQLAGQQQGIGREMVLDGIQAVDGRLDLRPVGGEPEQQLGTFRGKVRGDGDQVRRMEGAVQEPLGRVAGAGHRRRLGEAEIEEEHEPAPRRHRHAADRLRLVGGDGGEIEHLEAGDLLLLAPLVELEVGAVKAAHRLAVAHHLHRHLDDDDVGGLGEPLRREWRGRQPQRKDHHGEPKPQAWTAEPQIGLHSSS
jgi:hypothetical protein